MAEHGETREATSKGCGNLSEDRDARLIDPKLPAPNFFIVGAAKAGTTSLHAYLGQHPEVFMPALKEPHYFSSFVVRPEFDNFMPVVRDSCSYQKLYLDSKGRKAVGDASPSYLCDAGAPMRIKSAIPDAKIIISLRNPVHRAYSHYLMDFRQGRETRSFREALEADLGRSEKGWGVSFQYVELGLYAEQVERYLNVFGRERVLVVLFEDLVRETAVVMRQIADFLGIDPAAFAESTFEKVHHPFEVSRGKFARALLRLRPLRIWSKRWAPQGLRTVVRDRLLFTSGHKPRLDDETRRRLAGLFAADLKQLERMLGRDLGALRESW